VPWHAAMLTGGLAVDRVVGGHSLDQASTYSYLMGFNGAARDPLQHALPLVYTEPDAALAVLRNTCAWAKPDGDLPYALDGAKRPTNIVFRPSDANLWALWLAAEYAAATGDLAAFDRPLDYHPTYGAPAAPLREHLRRQFRFFVDVVGRGARGHVRILNADWNDTAVTDSGVDASIMTTQGSSVLNSAMAAWVLRVFAGLATRLGDGALAAEATAQADDLRGLVAGAWNGRWFHRVYAPGAPPVGDADCWLEVQPWAILCGAADDARTASLLGLIEHGHLAGSPLGARLRWPAPADEVAAGLWGDGTLGGVWYAIGMTLVWAAARSRPALAWDVWRRMTLASHTTAYPTLWEGTLSGPDAWNAPESTRPGRTWSAAPSFAMQAFPVNNMHSHSQPLLAYLRLLGVEPTDRGALAVGGGGDFRSRVFRLTRSGHGRLHAGGRVTVETRHGVTHGGPGRVDW
jgi:glycosyl hydrolase family 36